jgi:hypothetical protein
MLDHGAPDPLPAGTFQPVRDHPLMSFLPKSSPSRATGMPFAKGAKIATMLAALMLAAACGDDGPNYPDVFDPAAMQDELSTANAAMLAHRRCCWTAVRCA